VIRFGEGPSVSSEIAHYQAILLANCPTGARRDVYIMVTQPGEPRNSQPHQSAALNILLL
jgi:hypothetical protein